MRRARVFVISILVETLWEHAASQLFYDAGGMRGSLWLGWGMCGDIAGVARGPGEGGLSRARGALRCSGLTYLAVTRWAE